MSFSVSASLVIICVFGIVINFFFVSLSVDWFIMYEKMSG